MKKLLAVLSIIGALSWDVELQFKVAKEQRQLDAAIQAVNDNDAAQGQWNIAVNAKLHIVPVSTNK